MVVTAFAFRTVARQKHHGRRTFAPQTIYFETSCGVPLLLDTFMHHFKNDSGLIYIRLLAL
jgi:hypothetical protein